MTAMIYLDENCRLKAFSASAKGQSSVVKLEIACTDHFTLGHLLSELTRIQAETRPKAVAPVKSKKQPQLALPAPRLQLTHDRREF